MQIFYYIVNTTKCTCSTNLVLRISSHIVTEKICFHLLWE